MSYDVCVTCGKGGPASGVGVLPCDKPDCERKPSMAFAAIFGAENCRQPSPEPAAKDHDRG